MPRGGVVTGDEARFKDLALRGRAAGHGGRQRGDRGQMCDRLTSCTILNNSWTNPLDGPTFTPHKKTHSLCLWNRPESLFSIIVPDIRSSEIVTFELVARFDSHF